VLVDYIHTYTSRNLKLCNLFIDGYEINYINTTFHCLIIDSLQGCSCFQHCYWFASKALCNPESTLIPVCGLLQRRCVYCWM